MSGEGVELEIYHYSDWKIRRNTLYGATKIKYSEELKGVGGGSFTISKSDPALVADMGLIHPRNIAKVRIDGTVVGAFFLTKRKTVVIGEGEKADEAYEISGEGLKSLLSDAQVRPFGGLQAFSKKSRSFSFATLDGDWYRPGEWATPTDLYRVGDTPGSRWRYYPAKWPDFAPDAMWVWSQTGNKDYAPAGEAYFRLTFSVDVAGKYDFWVAADNSYVVYLDGESLAASDTSSGAFFEAKKVEMELAEGDHVIGIYATNFEDGPAAVTAALLANVNAKTPIDKGTVTIEVKDRTEIKRANHGLRNGTKIYFTTTGTMPNGLTANKNYYVVNAKENSFNVATGARGKPIKTTAAGTGTYKVLISGVPETKKLITYTGVSKNKQLNVLDAAKALSANRLAAYNALPFGDATAEAWKRRQAKAKAQALAQYRKAQAVQRAAQTAYDRAAAGVDAGFLWKVRGYPERAPGWTPGMILSTLLEEAADRGVRSAELLVPTWNKTYDSLGKLWPEPTAWTFDVSKSLMDVVAEMETLDVDIWINPDTYDLHMATDRVIDRTVITLDTNGKVLSTPVIFKQGKNLRNANVEASSKIVNSLAIKTEYGWLPWSVMGDTTEKYGVIEGTLDTDAPAYISKRMAAAVFRERQEDEDGATYDILPDDRIPFEMFSVGDLVEAPSEQGINTPRRVMSISVETSDLGNPFYSIEFDKVYLSNDQKVRKIVKTLNGGGGGGLGGPGAKSAGSLIAGGIATVSPPQDIKPINAPLAPTNVTIFSIGDWSADGVTSVSNATIAWEPVDTTTNGQEIVPATYEVWGHLSTEDDTTYARYASVIDPTTTIGPFNPNESWAFKVYAINDEGRSSEASSVATHVMTGPVDPPLPPSTPVLMTQNGLVQVTWDGKLGGAEPLPQFRYVFAEYATAAAGPWRRAGNALSRGGGNITIPGMVIGTNFFFRLIAVDGVGIPSAPSGTAQIVVKGVDFTRLDEALEQARQDVAAAQAAVDQLELNLAEMDLAITDIQSDVDLVMTSANGKNQVTFSVNEPTASTPGKVFGDIWWQRRSGTGELLGMWEWTNQGWAVRQFRNELIATLDAAKITTGFLDAARIRAESITSRMLAIGDFENLADDGTFESATSRAAFPRGGGWAYRESVEGSHTGSWYTVLSAGTWGYTTTSVGPDFQVSEGDVIYMEWWQRRYNADRAACLNLQVMDTSKATIRFDAKPVQPGPTAPNDVWIRYSGRVTMGAGSAWVRPQLKLNTDQPMTGSWAFDDIVIRRAVKGELLVDGSVTAEAIGAREITTVHLSAGAIDATVVQAGTFTGDLFQADTITTRELQVDSVDASIIRSGAIQVSHLSPLIGAQLDISANDSVQIVVGQIDEVRAGADATADNLEDMQTYYTFGTDGAVVSTPDSPFAVAIRNDRIEMLANGNVVSYWNAGQLIVPQFVGEKVVLGNHQLEKYQTGTVVRAV